ncbi:MAG: hypothetical protein IIY21_02510 [Clostridiales bacterium]|nr:hypothetical protein [Clostridiales bacterium]MBQ1570929.1 hypothetical protein [Clostridiales bacterium]
MLPSFCRDTVTRIRPGEKDSRGSTIPDWDNVTTVAIPGCSMQPASTTLSQDGRVLGITDTYTLFAPPDADIEAGDHIEFRNKVFEIDGDVRVQPSATGRLDHLNITLKRYQG